MSPTGVQFIRVPHTEGVAHSEMSTFMSSLAFMLQGYLRGTSSSVCVPSSPCYLHMGRSGLGLDWTLFVVT